MAPNWRATASLPGLASMTTMRPAGAMRAAWMTDCPMPPAPITATVSPGCTLARLSTAPAPVTTAQPIRHAADSGTSFGITTAWLSATTVRSVNTPALANWNAFSPPTVKGRLQLAHRVAAVGGLAAVAGVAHAAAAERGEHDVVAHLHLAHGVADLLHHASALVAEHDRRGERDGAVEHRDVGVAQAGVDDAHHHLVGARAAHLDVVTDLELAGPDEAPHRDATRLRAEDLAREAGVGLELAVDARSARR